MTVHVVRIRPFVNGPLVDAIRVTEIERSALHDFPDNIPRRFVAHRFARAGHMEIRVRWLGFTAALDTWESVENLVEDVPDMVRDYLQSNINEPACRRMMQRYF